MNIRDGGFKSSEMSDKVERAMIAFPSASLGSDEVILPYSLTKLEAVTLLQYGDQCIASRCTERESFWMPRGSITTERLRTIVQLSSGNQGDLAMPL